LKPLVDQYAKEGKDKKVTFEGVFSKPNSKPKWFLRKDVSYNNKNYLKYSIQESKNCIYIIFNSLGEMNERLL